MAELGLIKSHQGFGREKKFLLSLMDPRYGKPNRLNRFSY